MVAGDLEVYSELRSQAVTGVNASPELLSIIWFQLIFCDSIEGMLRAETHLTARQSRSVRIPPSSFQVLLAFPQLGLLQGLALWRLHQQMPGRGPLSEAPSINGQSFGGLGQLSPRRS